MGGHHGRTINHGKPGHLSALALALFDPHGRQAKCRVNGGCARQGSGRAAWVDRQQQARIGFAFAHHSAAQAQPVGAGFEFQVVADVHWRRQKPDVLRELLAHALDAHQEVALARLVHQANQPVTHFQAQGVDGLQVVPSGLGVSLRSFG